ncbi:MAG: DNA methyltransferase, partial [Methanothrix sp.]
MNKENNLDNVKSYLKEISKEYKTGIAKEHAYRPHLKDLIESFDSRLIAVNDPKRVDCGAVDFSVRSDELPIGYIETKDIWVSLDESENSEQIQRYLKALHNFVLTNYLEFRWYVDGELRKTALLAKKFGNSKIEPVAQGSIDAFALLDEFLNQEPEKIINASHLSSRLAYIAREIKEVVIKSFKSNKASQQIRDLRSAISDVLISDICLPEKTGE